ncbi:fimbrial protein [uncultured Parabacteroides sp.]|jgi:hypothetical protein|uniref:fimbrial protein n=1 Tax=uncultured Parabacteroides sp. TaxID=512312 RepID=UPI0025CEB369|nr:fimbrial protein [uncultured Parabacteroides sp.]
MKLRNLMYATMIACAFASCSKDDVPNPDNGQETKGTVLSVKFDAPLATKADGDIDEKIENLSMFVFSNGVLEVIGTSKEDNSKIAEAEVSLSDKNVLLVANSKSEISFPAGTSYETVIKALNLDYSFESTENGSLSMNSKLYTGLTITPNKVNCLGFNELPNGSVYVGGIEEAKAKQLVKMYRNVAKVVLTSVKTKETPSSQTWSAYKEPQLDIENVYILQAKKNTKLVPADASEYGATESDATFLCGSNFNNYEDDDMYPLVSAEEYAGYNIANTDMWTAVTKAGITPNLPFYVYENTDDTYKTLLVVAGKFSYLNQQNERTYVEGTRYYPVAIGHTNAQFSDAAKELLKLRSIEDEMAGVYRNLQYNVNLTIVGPGYQRPTGGGDPTMLESQVEVVAYGDVNQDVEI